MRYDTAVEKLYNAFNSGELNAMDCKRCAVGNLCDNNDEWVDVIPCGNSLKHIEENYRKRPMEGLSKYPEYEKGLKVIEKTGYSPYELMMVEALFLDKTGHKSGETKEEQFNGLIAVIEYLASLDDITIPQATIQKFAEV